MDEEKYTIPLPEPAKLIRKDGTVREIKELWCKNKSASLYCVSCGVCGKVLTFYEEKRIFKCALCGTEEENTSCCPEGHYMCKHCWHPTRECFPLEGNCQGGEIL